MKLAFTFQLNQHTRIRTQQKPTHACKDSHSFTHKNTHSFVSIYHYFLIILLISFSYVLAFFKD